MSLMDIFSGCVSGFLLSAYFSSCTLWPFFFFKLRFRRKSKDQSQLIIFFVTVKILLWILETRCVCAYICVDIGPFCVCVCEYCTESCWGSPCTHRPHEAIKLTSSSRLSHICSHFCCHEAPTGVEAQLMRALFDFIFCTYFKVVG